MSDIPEIFLYVITIGWKSGQAHEIEIWFVEHENRFYIIAENRENTHWAQNIRHNTAVQMRLDKDGTWQPAQGRFILTEMDAALVQQISALFQAKYNWSDGLIVEIDPHA